MKWFWVNSNKPSPTRTNLAKSERANKSASSRSARGDSSSGQRASRRRRRHSNSASLPKDIYNRSYYAPPQLNFYPPNVIRPQTTKTVNTYPGYFQNMASTCESENILAEEYAQELYRNQFQFFRPQHPVSNAHNVVEKFNSHFGYYHTQFSRSLQNPGYNRSSFSASPLSKRRVWGSHYQPKLSVNSNRRVSLSYAIMGCKIS